MSKRIIKKSVIGYFFFVVLITLIIMGVIFYNRDVKWDFKLKNNITIKKLILRIILSR